jgi:hypothetical protein
VLHNRRSLTCGYENQSFQDKDDVEQKCDSLVCAMSGVLNIILNEEIKNKTLIFYTPP